MHKHGGTPFRRDKYVTPAAMSPPGPALGRCVGGRQAGLADRKPPPLSKRAASSCLSQQLRRREPWGASPRPSAPTYLPRNHIAWVPEGIEQSRRPPGEEIRWKCPFLMAFS